MNLSFFRFSRILAGSRTALSVLLLLAWCFQSAQVCAKVYPLTDDPIDVIIPTTKKDLLTLDLCIKGIKENCSNLRRVIVISSERYTEEAEWFDENNYPFSKSDVGFYLCQGDAELANEYVNKKNSRVGWYFQQLLKFYAPFVIPDLSSNVLVLDSDTIFLNPVEFMNASNGGLYNVGNEHHLEYFRHIEKLTGGRVKKLYPRYSGITHHMLFQKPVVEDLFRLVESHHGIEFWKAFCLCTQKINGAGASEYELYFNFVMSRTEQVEVRKLKWSNERIIGAIHKKRKQGYHYVSCHEFLRG